MKNTSTTLPIKHRTLLRRPTHNPIRATWFEGGESKSADAVDERFRTHYPQNMASYCIDYFKLKQFEKPEEAGRSL